MSEPSRPRYYAADLRTRLETPPPAGTSPVLIALMRVTRQLEEEARVRRVLRGGSCVAAWELTRNGRPLNDLPWD